MLIPLYESNLTNKEIQNSLLQYHRHFFLALEDVLLFQQQMRFINLSVI